MQAEIVTIGTELLLGEIVDTNSAWIAQQLTTIGLNLFYTTTVGDNLQRITEVLRHSLERSDVVITTGGLGPTVDDMTRDAVAAATDRDLVLDEDLLQEIACFFARRSYPMTENNRKQACLPAGARVIHNPVGTAPSFAVEHNDHVIISLPGVPFEMKYLMEHDVLPYLRERFDLRGIIKSRTLRTCGIGESMVDSKIGDLMHLANPTVGTAAHPGQTDVRITVKAQSEAEADALIAPVERELRARLNPYVYGVDQETLSDAVVKALSEKGLRLALAETVTHGDLSRWMSEAVSAERAFAGGTTLLGEDSLLASLDVPVGLVGQYGLASQQTADAVAEAVRRAHKADLGLAVIGTEAAVSGEAQEGTPPVYFSLAVDGQVIQGEPRKGRTGVSGRGWLMHLALDMVRRYLLGLPVS